MNKLLLSSNDELNNLVIDQDSELLIRLNDEKKSLNIIVEDNFCLNILEIDNNTENDFLITLKENSRLIYNKAGKNIKDKVIVNLDGNNSSVVINSSVVSSEDSFSFFEIRHNANNTISNLSNHGVNAKNNELIFKIDAFIPVGSISCKTSQENKIININNGKSSILPNLIVDTDDVEANHSAFIGDFDKDILFYLKSRGLTLEKAKELLISGFLIGNLEFDSQSEVYIKETLKY